MTSAAHTLVKAVQGLKREDWSALLNVATSPTPRAGKVNPDILLNGLGPVGSHVIPQDMWEQAVPPNFYGQELRDFDVEIPWVNGRGNARPGAPPWVSNEVTKFVGVLKRQCLLYDLSEDLPPTFWPFMIAKTSEKVSLILRCVQQNGLDGCSPPRFSLRSWEQLSKLLVTFYQGVPLYGTHIDFKNAFCSFVLPDLAHTVFHVRSGPSGRVVGLGRLPFGWKYSPFICQQTLARIVERVLPPDVLLVHYLDDFLLVHYDKGYLRDNTGNTVIALGHEGFIVSPKSVLEPTTQLDVLGEVAGPRRSDGVVT